MTAIRHERTTAVFQQLPGVNLMNSSCIYRTIGTDCSEMLHLHHIVCIIVVVVAAERFGQNATECLVGVT